MKAYRNGVLVDLTDEEIASIAAENALTPEKLGAHAAAKRYAVETGGTVWNGFIIQTDRESQSKLIAEFVAMSAGLRTDPSPWKFANGFASVTNAEMQSVIIQARAHVLAAFATEGVVAAGIGSNAITSYEQVEAADWPSNS